MSDALKKLRATGQKLGKTEALEAYLDALPAEWRPVLEAKMGPPLPTQPRPTSLGYGLAINRSVVREVRS